MKTLCALCLLCVLCGVSASCDYKDLCYDHNHWVEVRVVFDWEQGDSTAFTKSLKAIFPQMPLLEMLHISIVTSLTE